MWLLFVFIGFVVFSVFFMGVDCRNGFVVVSLMFFLVVFFASAVLVLL